MRPVSLLILLVLPYIAVTAVTAEETYLFTGQWGACGSEPGRFLSPVGIASDSAGAVYVTDTGNSRVQKFGSDGTFLAEWGENFLAAGTANGSLDHPGGIAVDGAGHVYVTDTYHHRVVKFTDNGTFVTAWGAQGSGDGYFYGPEGIAVDRAGTVYVADTGNHRVQTFMPDGSFLAKWGTPGYWGNGEFQYPHGIAVDAAGTVYVADHNNHRVQTFASNGSFLAIMGCWGCGGDREMYSPDGIAVDDAGDVYVTDLSQYQYPVKKFASNGTFLAKWGTSGGNGNGQFNAPRGVAVDGAGYVYVVDSGNNRVQTFARPGVSPIPVVPGGSGAPTDTNADGKYDDINGNRRTDFADIVLYFGQMSWIAANEPVDAFDFNGNGSIDFADVVWLFDQLDAPAATTFTVTAVAVGPGAIVPSGNVSVPEGGDITFSLENRGVLPTPYATHNGYVVGNHVLVDPAVPPTPHPTEYQGPYSVTPSYTLHDVRADHTVYGCFYYVHIYA